MVALMLTLVLAATDEVLIVNVPEDAPAFMVILAGTEATALLALVRLITTPDGPAGELSVTVPTEAPPPFTLVGETVKLV
jgi:hypothetical protein